MDVVFSNWLLMYLSDKEIQILVKKILSWLNVGGYLFFRESCYHQSGNKKRGENPTEYRTPMQYVELCESAQEEDALNPGRFYVLDPIFGKSVEAYVTVGILNMSAMHGWRHIVCSHSSRKFTTFKTYSVNQVLDSFLYSTKTTKINTVGSGKRTPETKPKDILNFKHFWIKTSTQLMESNDMKRFMAKVLSVLEDNNLYRLAQMKCHRHFKLS